MVGVGVWDGGVDVEAENVHRRMKKSVTQFTHHAPERPLAD